MCPGWANILPPVRYAARAIDNKWEIAAAIAQTSVTQQDYSAKKGQTADNGETYIF